MAATATLLVLLSTERKVIASMGTSGEGWYDAPVPGQWEYSGIPGTQNYDGYAWYARTFEVPGHWRGKKIILHIGAADDESWTYVNGQFAGACLSTDFPDHAWETPYEMDLTDRIRWDKPNLVAIRVLDTWLYGGLWKSIHLRAEDSKEPIIGPGAIEVKAPATAATQPSGSK